MSTRTVVVRMTSEITREARFTFNVEEFLAWSGGEQPTPKLVKEFIQNDRDREEIEDSLWSQSKEVDSTAAPFVDIEEIIL